MDRIRLSKRCRFSGIHYHSVFRDHVRDYGADLSLTTPLDTTTAVSDTPYVFDGDSKSDISIFRPNTGEWWINRSATNATGATQFGVPSDKIAPGDYTGDGKTDNAVIRRTIGTNGAMVWWILNSQTSSTTAYQFGINTDFAAPGDSDGDGRFDYAVYRAGANASTQSVYYVARSSDNGFTIAPWGVGGDWVVPGDYDGDGKTNFAVVRRSTSPSGNVVWYILQSLDGNLQATSSGITESDVPVQNDYDGDGKTDVSMWRETDGNFYVLKTTGSGGNNFCQLGLCQRHTDGFLRYALEDNDECGMQNDEWKKHSSIHHSAFRISKSLSIKIIDNDAGNFDRLF